MYNYISSTLYYTYNSIISKVGGNFTSPPSSVSSLSSDALSLIDKCFEDIHEPVFDYHTHIVGIGSGDSGCCVHSSLKSYYHPFRRVKYDVFLSACDVKTEEKADQEFVGRVRDLITNIRPKPWGQHFILGFDAYYDQDGKRQDGQTGIYTPNEYIWSLCKTYPEEFLPCISVHPYRKDATEELEKWARKGVRMVKWLPNAQGMNPASELCDKFYEEMEEQNMVLLSHAGHENSVDAGGTDQTLGNPLLLRRPLEKGVKVIVAHCASEGKTVDLESETKNVVSNFDMWIRLMEEQKYVGYLYSDISSVTLFRRIGVLPTLLERKEWHGRLINGSDYPVPAINAVVHTSALQKMNLLNSQEKVALDEIYGINPLLFDFCLKRSLKLEDGTKFPSSIFTKSQELSFLHGPFDFGE